MGQCLRSFLPGCCLHWYHRPVAVYSMNREDSIPPGTTVPVIELDQITARLQEPDITEPRPVQPFRSVELTILSPPPPSTAKQRN
jgi:hypothetical protein